MIIASPSDTTVLSSAFDLVGDAVTDIGTTQAALGVQADQLSNLISHRNETKIGTLDDLASQAEGTPTWLKPRCWSPTTRNPARGPVLDDQLTVVGQPAAIPAIASGFKENGAPDTIPNV
ncbi:hypothetical protein ACRAWD_22585 [Caulobacter segnis]